MRIRTKIIEVFVGLVMVTSVFSVSCVKSPATVTIPNHPGAVNPVDNTLYDGILSARAAIVTAQDQFKDNAKVIMMLNQSVLPPFNRLEAAYSAYHTALVAGKADPALPAQLQVQLDSVKAALTEALKGAVVPVK